MLAPPPFRVRLTKPVGTAQSNRPEDVTAIQGALDGFAQYPLKTATPGRHDEGLASALRTVQRRFGLKADGIAKPGGPTEFLLNLISAGGVTALAPDRAKAPDRASFRRRLLLKRPVGEGGGNDPDDEAVVRHGLTLLGDLPLGAVVPGNRLEDRAFGDAIERFHRRRGLPPVRAVKPGSPAAIAFATELGIAYADKLPEEAPSGPLPVANRHGGKPRPAADRQDDISEDRPVAAHLGEYGSEPVLGAINDEDFLRRASQATGVAIPRDKDVKDTPGVLYNWLPWSEELQKSGLGRDSHFAMMNIFAWEGGLKADRRMASFALSPAFRMINTWRNTLRTLVFHRAHARKT